MALTARINLSVAPNQTGTNDFQNPSYAPTISKALSFADGGGLNQVQYLFADQDTIADGGNDDLDLAGTLTDAFGATITFATIKFIYVDWLSSNTTNLTIGGGTNPFLTWVGSGTDTVGPITPGGFFCIANPAAAGWAVTAGTGDILRLANSAGAIGTYNIVIMGD